MRKAAAESGLIQAQGHPPPDPGSSPRRRARPHPGATTPLIRLRSHENKTTAEVHDYLDERTDVFAAMLAKRAPGYTGLGFSDPRKLALSPSASTDS